MRPLLALALAGLRQRAVCPPGTAGDACAPCAAGTFSPAPGASTCLDAPPGEFVANRGQAAAQLCAPGTFAASAKSTSCEPCAEGTSSAIAGSTTCAPCPAGTSASNGAATCTLDQASSTCAAGPLATYVLLSDGRTISSDLGEAAFNKAFAKCGIVRYSRNGQVHSVYKRLTPVPVDFNAYHVFTNTWSSQSNVLNTDFEIFSTCDELASDEGKWGFCNYDDADVGYPRDCGKSGPVAWEWFSMPGDRFDCPGVPSGAAFELVHECDSGPGVDGVTTTTSTTYTTTYTTTTTSTTTGASLRRFPGGGRPRATADPTLDSGAVQEATAAAEASGSRLGWHMTWNPKPDREGQEFIHRVCSGASKVCERYVQIMHECYPGCESKLAAAAALRGDDPDYQDVGATGVQAHQANREAKQGEWEQCLTDCVVRPSCPKMCGTDTAGCLPKCYDNYRPMVASMEKIYARVHDLELKK